MKNIRIKTLSTEKFSNRASHLFASSKLKKILIPADDYKFYTISTQKNVFQKSFKVKNQNKTKNKSEKFLKKVNYFYFNSKYKSSFRIQKKDTALVSNNKLRFDLHKKVLFLEKDQKNLQNLNCLAKKDKKTNLAIKNQLSQDILNNFQFKKKNLEHLRNLKQRFYENNLNSFQAKKKLLSQYLQEKKNIEYLKNRISKANDLLNRLADFKEKNN